MLSHTQSSSHFFKWEIDLRRYSKHIQMEEKREIGLVPRHTQNNHTRQFNVDDTYIVDIVNTSKSLVDKNSEEKSHPSIKGVNLSNPLYMCQVNESEEETNTYLCRICLQDEPDKRSLISPCRCSGTSQYVHRTCLAEWRNTSVNPLATKLCLVCHTKYQIKPVPHYFMRGKCHDIRFNFFTVFTMHQSVNLIISLILTQILLPMKNIPDYKFGYNTVYQFDENGFINQMNLLSFLYSLSFLITGTPIFLYAFYVWLRYVRLKSHVVSETSKLVCPYILPSVIFSGGICVIFPHMLVFFIGALSLFFDIYVTKFFHVIERTNSKYHRDIVVDYIPPPQELQISTRANPIIDPVHPDIDPEEIV